MLELELAAAGLLGDERSRIVGMSLPAYLLSGESSRLFHHLKYVFGGMRAISRLSLSSMALCYEVKLTSGTPCRIKVSGSGRPLSRVAALALYRIAQEALGNAVVHAHAKSIEVSLYGDDKCLVLQISDDGLGIDLTVVRSVLERRRRVQ